MKHTKPIILRAALLLPLLAGCNKTGDGQTSNPDDGQTTGDSTQISAPPPADAPERPKLSRAECEAKGARVVGDIGDGAIHRPDYVCESGEAPIATIAPGEGEPIATEGEVCCPG
ncbi:MAG: hypothetical protein KC457_36845 [Myxococcales bacterium]|nr:hypothetical protein [Myxococcales bacterium]